MGKKTVKLNEKIVNVEEFEEKKKEVEKMKNAKLVEVGPDEFKIRLYD